MTAPQVMADNNVPVPQLGWQYSELGADFVGIDLLRDACLIGQVSRSLVVLGETRAF